eukprot:Pgem_evm1s1008
MIPNKENEVQNKINQLFLEMKMIIETAPIKTMKNEAYTHSKRYSIQSQAQD